MKNIYWVAMIAVLANGCGKPGKPVEKVEEITAKSTAYYSAIANRKELKEVVQKCLIFEKNEFSLMPPSKQTAWLETSAGINCSNARQAYGRVLLIESSQRWIDSEKKFMGK